MKIASQLFAFTFALKRFGFKFMYKKYIKTHLTQFNNLLHVLILTLFCSLMQLSYIK